MLLRTSYWGALSLSGETGGAMPLTSMDDPVLLVHQVLEGAVEKICVTKVSAILL